MKHRHRLAAIPALGVLAALAAPALAAAPAIAANAQRQVVDVVALDGPKTSEELTRTLVAGDGATVVDPDDYTSATSTLRRTDGVSALADRPATFDLRDVDFDGDGAKESYVTEVKLQNPWNTCWAFGSNAAAETSVLTETHQPYVEDDPNALNFSEKHLAWFSMTPEVDGDQIGEGYYTNLDGAHGKFDTGGDMQTATSLYSTGTGPIDESWDPSLGYHNLEGDYELVGEREGISIYQPSVLGDWSVPEDLRRQMDYELEETYYLPSPASWESTDDPQVKEYVFNQAGVNAIKDQLLAGRGVSIGFCADQSQPGNPSPAHYMNENTWAHYTYESPNEGPDKGGRSNHMVCVVGYDDTYSKDNFVAEHQPPEDGAFIVKNSWGAVDSSYGNQNLWGVDGSGYFYLSYYDKSIACAEAFDFITPYDEDLTYGTTDEPYEVYEYQYAFLPDSPTGTDYAEGVTSMANVYEMYDTSVIRTVSVQTKSFDTSTRFDIYLMDEDATNPSDGKLVWSHDESFPFGGYHRVELDQPLLVEAGDRLGVVCTMQLDNGAHEIVNNQYYTEDFMKMMEPQGIVKWGEAVMEPGESFVGAPSQRIEYSDGSYAYDGYVWSDFADVISEGEKASSEAIAKAGIADLVKARDEALARYATVIPDDPDYEEVQRELNEAKAALEQAVMAIEDEARFAYKAQDNFPINVTAEAYDPENPPTAETVEMFRLYDPATGEHLYTSDAHERDVLTRDGWSAEGTGWTAPAKSNTQVWRVYDPATGEHLYTSDPNERAALTADGWIDEGLAFHSDPNRATPVYRLFNPTNPGISSHHYTADAHERDVLVRNGWRNEGVAWYGA